MKAYGTRLTIWEDGLKKREDDLKKWSDENTQLNKDKDLQATNQRLAKTLKRWAETSDLLAKTAGLLAQWQETARHQAQRIAELTAQLTNPLPLAQVVLPWAP